jgi:hypothetical protein
MIWWDFGVGNLSTITFFQPVLNYHPIKKKQVLPELNRCISVS